MVRLTVVWLLRVMCAMVIVFVVAPVQASENAISCIKEMTVPNAYSSIYIYLPVIVEVKIEIGSRGKARNVVYSTSIKSLQLQLDGYFKEKTQYLDSCEGKTITFTVQYLVEGRTLDGAFSEVRLLPPDRLIVVCHPIRPALDPVRLPPR